MIETDKIFIINSMHKYIYESIYIRHPHIEGEKYMARKRSRERSRDKERE